MTVADVNEKLQKLQDWLREPDFAEHFGTDDLVDWLNRRPTSVIPSILATRAAPPAMDREAAYRQALEDVCNPLGYLQRMADAEGAKLSGMAYAIASDIGTIQRIAKEALSTLSADAIRQGEGERGFCNKCGFVGVPQKGGFHYRPKDGQPCNYICPVSATPASHASDGGKA